MSQMNQMDQARESSHLPPTLRVGESSRRMALPLLLWRRGLGRGGSPTFPVLWVGTIFRRVAAPIEPAGWLRTTASSPCPSPPKEERETAARPVEDACKEQGEAQRRHRCSGRAPLPKAARRFASRRTPNPAAVDRKSTR